MRKNTFLSVALLAASVSVVNAQEAPKELFWQNSSNTGIWSIMDSFTCLQVGKKAVWQFSMVVVRLLMLMVMLKR